MAFNKTSAIQEAQKLVAQGKLKEAVSAYQKIYNKDPKDQNVLNTLGDLHVRLNRTSEALQFYIQLADMYAGEGFLVRGIAMYKKISKLNPGNTHALARLADLYTMQGMLADARAHYLELAEAHLKANQTKDAMEVLHKVLDLDPDNIKIQKRLAELYERHNQPLEAAGIYRRLSEHLLAEGSEAESRRWMEKAVALAPDSPEVLLSQARLQQQAGNPQEALATLERFPRPEESAEALELLIGLQLETGNAAAAAELAEKLFSSDTSKFSGLLQLAQHAARQGASEQAVGYLDRVVEAALQHDPLHLLEAARDVATCLPDSEPAQELLVRAARQAHNHSAAMEGTSRLAQAAAAREDWEKAKQLYSELVTLEPTNPEFTRTLREVRLALGEEVAVEARPTETMAPVELPPEMELDEDTRSFVDSTTNDIDLFSSYGMADKAIELAEQLVARVPSHIAGNEKLLDLYIGTGNDRKVAEIAARLELLHRRAGNLRRAEECANLARGYAEKAGIGMPAAEAAPAVAAMAAPVEEPALPAFEIPAVPAAEAEAATYEVDLSADWATAAEEAPTGVEVGGGSSLVEAREEIEFYLNQGLVDQARAVLTRCQREFPDAPELAELRDRVESAEVPAEESVETGGPSAIPVEAAAAVPFEVRVEPAAPPEPEPARVEEAGETYEVVLEEVPSEAQPAPAAAGMSAQDFFSELAGEFDQPQEGVPAPRAATPAPPPPRVMAAPAAPVEEVPTGALAEVFAEFKQEMGDIEDVEDIESHYNLGIAYKEMALMDEAVSEFQKVARAAEQQRDYSRLFQACTLLGLCFLEKGHPQIAVRWYERALKTPGVDEEGALALRYDMGTAHEQAGNRKAALDCFMEVYGVNVDYRDVSDRIRELQGA